MPMHSLAMFHSLAFTDKTLSKIKRLIAKTELRTFLGNIWSKLLWKFHPLVCCFAEEDCRDALLKTLTLFKLAQNGELRWTNVVAGTFL